MRGFLAKDFRVSVVVWWDDLVPSANGFVCSLFSELLRYRCFRCSSGGGFHDAEVQFISGFEEGVVLRSSPKRRRSRILVSQG